jgi:hypothetical protein
LVVEDTPQGLRALVHIDSPEAPERFDFPIGGDVATLRLTEDGGAAALNELGEVITVAAPPWATDAIGTSVPTHDEIHGTTLTQVVEHHGGTYTYGIVADPWWNPFSWLDDIWNSVSGVSRATFDSAATPGWLTRPGRA